MQTDGADIPLAAPERGASLIDTIVAGAAPFLAVFCLFAYYGQQHRVPSGDTYGTVMTAAAVVQQRTIWLDDYLPYIEARSGERPYMVTTGREGRPVNVYPFAPVLSALPVVLVFDLAGTAADDWDSWMEAGMLTGAMTATLSVLVLFRLMTRLTTRRRAFLAASTYAFGTLTWGVAGQALWQHAPAMLALTIALLALNDRRLFLAGASLAVMVACRPSAPVIALFLLPLVGRSARDWCRFIVGALPVGLALLAYNLFVFGGPLRTGYAERGESTSSRFEGELLEGLPGLLVSPGRGLFVYSPILIFSVVGAVTGFQRPLYRWVAIAALAYVLAMSKFVIWWGGESFGPRLLADTLPLLALLLVPALHIVERRRWLRRVFGLTLAWSLAVQALGAAAWTETWFDLHDQFDDSIWWSLRDNELVSMAQESGSFTQLGRLAVTLAVGLAFAFVAAHVSLSFTNSAATRAAGGR